MIRYLFLLLFYIAYTVDIIDASALLEQYEIITSDRKLEIKFAFSKPRGGTVEYNSRKNYHSIIIENARSPYFKDRQNLDHLLAISFYIKPVGKNLKLIFYPRGNIPVSSRWENDRSELIVSFSNIYPLRSQLDPNSENFLICIDPGHGGHDPGAQGRHNVEKDVVLKMSHVLKREIAKRDGFSSFLTRNSDYKIKLEDRPKICDRANSDLFISLHMNSSTPPTRGFEIFYLSDKGAEESLQPKLLETELSGAKVKTEGKSSSLKPSLTRHIMLEKILINLKQTETLNSSAHLAHSIEKHFKSIKGSKSRGVHRQEYVVLKNVQTPSVLFEMGFITNSRDEKFFTTQVTQELAARKIVDGIVEFIRKANLRPRVFRAPSSEIESELFAPDKSKIKKVKYYEVQKGDTFIKIAEKFNIPYLQLMALNPDVKPVRMQVGFRIKVPAIDILRNSK